MNRASDIFNALPIEVRRQTIPSNIEMRINQIHIDQDKAKSAHAKFMAETNGHVRNLKQSLERALAELDTPKGETK
jgi:hypothetical protein